jgi:putative phosphoribosyl transferase
VVVLALPRGGVEVAEAIARRLHAPLGLVLVRKVRTPGFPELAMGAVAQVGGEVAIARHAAVATEYGVPREHFEREVDREREALADQARRYEPPQIDVRGRTVVVVDDGLATGMTMQAAVEAVRRAGAARVVLAVPVASASGLQAIPADITVCPLVPAGFRAVSSWYRHFDQTTDAEVLAALKRAADELHPPAPEERRAGGPPDGSPDTAR